MVKEDFPLGDKRLVLSLSGRDVECATFGSPADQVKGVAVICHPHPLFGGTMDNKVVHTLWRAFKSAGINALRFNFRGVGQSEGVHDNGKGEVDDLVEIINWLSSTFPEKPIYLAGFSFGAFVAASYAAREHHLPLAHLILVAPPVHHFNMEAIRRLDAPVSIIMGEKDELVPVVKVRDWADALSVSAPLRQHFLPEATHFFHGHLGRLKELVFEDLELG